MMMGSFLSVILSHSLLTNHLKLIAGDDVGELLKIR